MNVLNARHFFPQNELSNRIYVSLLREEKKKKIPRKKIELLDYRKHSLCFFFSSNKLLISRLIAAF